jgi:hypothetical protein
MSKGTQHFAHHWLFAEHHKDETIWDDRLTIYGEGVQQNPYNLMC